jgi:uncharacterized protein (DUF488 family)
MKIYTIGHSTRTIDDFIAILNTYKINTVVDVRSIPYSRFNPQFNSDSLKESLNDSSIDYVHISSLGGFRDPVSNSVNTGWKNRRFRGFADHMQMRDFKRGLNKLVKLARDSNVVIMCSEALPWRCHRSLIADALIVRGIEVVDIYSINTIRKHSLTPWAVVNGHNIIYPKFENTIAS